MSKDGRKYVGSFADGVIQGEGTLTYANCMEYTGDFDLGRYSGQGTLFFPDGREYSGAFRNNVIYSQGE